MRFHRDQEGYQGQRIPSLLHVSGTWEARVSPISRRRTSPEGGYAIMLCIWLRTSLEPLDSVIALPLDELEFGLEGTNGRAAGL